MTRDPARVERVPAFLAREWVLAALGAAAGTLLVFGGALATYFSQDDFQYLAYARGLIPASLSAWRPVANLAYFGVLERVAGLDPVPYHAASLVLHALGVTLAYAYLRRFAGRGAAALGAGLMLAHPALFTALYWISAVNVPLMAVWALLALHLEQAPGGRRWLSLPFLMLALLTRESAVALPLAAIALRAHQRTLRARDPVLIAWCALALLEAAALFAGNALGVRSGAPAYHPGFGASLVLNLLTYLGWTADVAAPLVRGFGDAVDPQVFGWGIAALAVWIAGACVPALRRRGWIVGGAWYVALLTPVLPLVHHTYHYYLDLPLLGVAWCAAAAFDACCARRPARWTTALGVALAALFAWNGAVLVRIVERHPFLQGLRADPTVDRAAIARRAAADLAAARLPPGTELWFWSPTSIELEQAAGHDTRAETYWERNVRAALLDGVAVRVLFPQVAGVRFVRRFEPAPDSVRYAIYRLDGSLGVASSAQIVSLLNAHPGSNLP